jgi:hypothetical protein
LPWQASFKAPPHDIKQLVLEPGMQPDCGIYPE